MPTLPRRMMTPRLRRRSLAAAGLCLLLSMRAATAQVVTFEPAFPSVDEPVTVYFHAAEGTGGLAGYTGDVYAHTGVITDRSTTPSDWKYVKTSWGQNTPDTRLERVGADVYRLSIPDVRAYYGVPASEKILQLAFVFRSEQPVGGSYLEGKDTGGRDIFVDLYEPGVNVRFVRPAAGPLEPVIANQDTTIEVVAVGGAVGSPFAGLRLLVGGAEVAQTAADTLVYALALHTPGRVDVQAIAADAAGRADTASFYAVRNPALVEADLPAGVQDGINYDPDDPTQVTLSLYAPFKNFVYVLGDFTNWEVDPDYLMKRDFIRYDSVRYWITLDGLEPGREYAFQYFVDGELRMADLFSHKVLVPGDDAFISEATYPNLKPYPEGRTTGIVSVIETGQEPFAFVPFDRPAQKDLIIYELLLRDFLAARDFATLTDTLDYLDRLGVNAIELMPVSEFAGNLSWGYNPDFHLAVDKYYGPAEDLKRFVDEAHRRGMAVILDVVYNHAHDASPLVQLYGPIASNPYINIPARHPFNVFFDLNHEHPYVQYWLDRANAYWLEAFNVDGYRFDLSKGFTQQHTSDVGVWSAYDASRVRLLQRMAEQIWSIDPEAYIILEHFGSAEEERELAAYGTDRGLPGMMLWGKETDPYNEATMGYHGSGKSDFAAVYYRRRGLEVPNLVGYMESHDEERLMYKNLRYGNSSGAYRVQDVGVALERMKAAGAFFFTIPGPKMIWQFGELGYDYSIDYNGRTGEKPIRWDYWSDPLRQKLYRTWQALIRLRREHEVFTSTETAVTLNTSGPVKTIKLSHPTMDVVIAGNFDVIARDVAPGFPAAGTWYDYFSGEPVEITDPAVQLSLLPGQFYIYTSQYVEPPEPGLITVDAEEEAGGGWPLQFELEQNYPNPFNPVTTIAYAVPAARHVRLVVYDVLGRQVAVLADGLHQPGRHEATFDAGRLPSGVYLYRLEAEGQLLTGRMLLVK